MKKNNLVILSMALPVVLTACSGTKGQISDKLGLGRKNPDEFAIIKRAPLEIPPNLIALPVPNKGAPRPQEDTAQESAQTALFGEEETTSESSTSNAEQALLERTKANEANPNIRNIVNEETEKYAEEDQAVIDKLLKRKKVVPGSVLDAREEIGKLKEKNIPTPNVPEPVEE